MYCNCLPESKPNFCQVKQWFGSQEAFESKVSSEIAEILSHDLERVFTTKSALAAFMPVMWAFMDLAASEWKLPYQDLWHFNSAAFLLDGLTIWLVICPLIKDGVVLVGKLTKARGSTPCWEVLKNLLLTAMFMIPAELIQGIYIILFVPRLPAVVPRPFVGQFLWMLTPLLLGKKGEAGIMTILGAGIALLGLHAVLCAAIPWFHPRP